MTTPSDDRTPADDDRTADPGSSRPDEAAGVELGLSEGAGGTFEPEEDVAPDN